MTETEWFASNDPQVLLAWVSGRTEASRRSGVHDPCHVSDRKLRLFAAACALHLIGQPTVPLTGWDKWAERESHRGGFSSLDGARYWVGVKIGQNHALHLAGQDKTQRAALLREVVGNPFRPAILPWVMRTTQLEVVSSSAATDTSSLVATCSECPWLTWRDRTVPRLARTIYDGCLWDQMPILADALEEAGCPDGDLLRHCRGYERCPYCQGQGYTDLAAPAGYECRSCQQTGWVPLRGPHCRGCWVLDCLLGLT